METFFKRMFAGWFILALITFTAYPQGPANLSAAYPQGPISPYDMMPAPRALEVDVPATSGPSTPFAILAGSARAGHLNKNGSDYFTGSGTAVDPWLIATATDLDNVRHFVGETHQGKHFRQTANIDLGVIPWNEGEGWVPLGNSIDPFHGQYDGNGHEVSNLVIARDTIEYQGLFGRNNGTIMNLGVVNAQVTDNGSRAGILVGINNAGIIEDCYSSGVIQCDHEAGRIGGLAGWNNGTIRHSSSAAAVHTTGVISGGLTGSNSGGGTLINCFATGDVIGNEHVGGLSGSSQVGGQIISCHATGEVSGTIYIGGLIGIMRAETTTDDCYATGKVRGGSSVGGLVGYVNEATIKKSFFSGTVEGESRVGGLAGILSQSTIFECFSEGKVHTRGNWVGGLTGLAYQESHISFSYSTADVSAEGYTVGGLSGSLESNSSIENAYATGNVSGMDWTGGLVGWFEESSIHSSFFSGSVEGENRVGGLAGSINNATMSACYSEGEVFARGGIAGGLAGSIYSNSAVSGCFSNANVKGEGDYAGGLSGTLQSESSIENAHFTGNVSGMNMTGGLVGWCGESFINNSFFSGSVEGESRVGGLAGTLRNATISKCHTEGQVNARGNWAGGIAGTTILNSKVSESFSVTDVLAEGYIVGGLIGNLSGGSSIENAYSVGNLLGTNWVGGLVGWADSSSITNAYTANYMFALQANVSGGLTNGVNAIQTVRSYWNTETTGEEESAGGEGKTNAEMTSQATFTDWDFENTWGITENETYPYLIWQDGPGKHNFPVGLYMLTLTTSPEDAGTLGRDGLRPEGSLILITTMPNDKFVFIDWTDDEGNTFSTDSVIRFIMPGKDLSLTARYHATEHSITITSGENGMVDPEGEIIVDYGSDLVVTITPDEGYRVAFIRLNGVDIDLENDPHWDAASGTFTVASIDVDQHLEVDFELITFKLLFLVTDAKTGTEIPDATINMADNWHEAGKYIFEQMVPGSYNYLVSRAGYFDKGGTANIDDDDITETVELEVDDTSLSNTDVNRLRIYPNPASGEIWVDLPGSHGEKATLQIYNLQGQTVFEKSVVPASNETLHINLGSLQPGIYLLSMTTNEGVHVERLVVK